jgi:hypothetical protein
LWFRLGGDGVVFVDNRLNCLSVTVCHTFPDFERQEKYVLSLDKDRTLYGISTASRSCTSSFLSMNQWRMSWLYVNM